jgi:hypothetical protein
MRNSDRPRAARWALPIGLLAASLGATASGCGGGAVERAPELVVRDFAGALRGGRPADAYALMSSAYRRRVSLEEFRRHLTDSPAEAREAAASLEQPDGPATQIARVLLADGDTVELVRDGADWRIATNLVDFYDQSTPRAAIRSFVRAMERARYDVVLRFVPEADREGMSAERMRTSFAGEGREEIARLLTELRAGLDAPIEEIGDHATLRYGEGNRRTARLIREGGSWKVEDPDE